MAASVVGTCDLIPLPHHEPLALLLIELELSDGGSFGRLLIRRVHIPDVLGARSQDRDAPSAELRGRGDGVRMLLGRIGQRRENGESTAQQPRIPATQSGQRR